MSNQASSVRSIYLPPLKYRNFSIFMIEVCKKMLSQGSMFGITRLIDLCKTVTIGIELSITATKGFGFLFLHKLDFYRLNLARTFREPFQGKVDFEIEHFDAVVTRALNNIVMLHPIQPMYLLLLFFFFFVHHSWRK